MELSSDSLGCCTLAGLVATRSAVHGITSLFRFDHAFENCPQLSEIRKVASIGDFTDCQRLRRKIDFSSAFKSMTHVQMVTAKYSCFYFSEFVVV
jgi:hypothetical protein